MTTTTMPARENDDLMQIMRQLVQQNERVISMLESMRLKSESLSDDGSAAEVASQSSSVATQPAPPVRTTVEELKSAFRKDPLFAVNQTACGPFIPVITGSCGMATGFRIWTAGEDKDKPYDLRTARTENRSTHKMYERYPLVVGGGGVATARCYIAEANIVAAELPVLSQILSELNQSFHLRDGVWLAARFSLLIVADDNQILPETSAKAANDRHAGVLLVVLPSENTSEGEITVTNPSLKEPVIFDAAAINGPDRAASAWIFAPWGSTYRSGNVQKTRAILVFDVYIQDSAKIESNPKQETESLSFYRALKGWSASSCTTKSVAIPIHIEGNKIIGNRGLQSWKFAEALNLDVRLIEVVKDLAPGPGDDSSCDGCFVPDSVSDGDDVDDKMAVDFDEFATEETDSDGDEDMDGQDEVTEDAKAKYVSQRTVEIEAEWRTFEEDLDTFECFNTKELHGYEVLRRVGAPGSEPTFETIPVEDRVPMSLDEVSWIGTNMSYISYIGCHALVIHVPCKQQPTSDPLGPAPEPLA